MDLDVVIYNLFFLLYAYDLLTTFVQLKTLSLSFLSMPLKALHEVDAMPS